VSSGGGGGWAPSGAGPGPGEGGPGDVKDERDKEWAALTTWIRMNLHQPRTAKRKVRPPKNGSKHLASGAASDSVNEG